MHSQLGQFLFEGKEYINCGQAVFGLQESKLQKNRIAQLESSIKLLQANHEQVRAPYTTSTRVLAWFSQL